VSRRLHCLLTKDILRVVHVSGIIVQTDARQADRPVLVRVVVARLWVVIVFVDVITGKRVLKTAGTRSSSNISAARHTGTDHTAIKTTRHTVRIPRLRLVVNVECGLYDGLF